MNSDTTIPNNKPDIIRDDEKGTYLTIDATESVNIIMIKKGAHRNIKNGSDNSHKRGSWNSLTIIQVIPQNHSENT
jgi:hypothetical protein